MTAPDVRTAAQAEAERRHRLNPDHMRARVFFLEGAVWGAALVTPTREKIAEAAMRAANRGSGKLDSYEFGQLRRDIQDRWLAVADAVLALMHALNDNESIDA